MTTTQPTTNASSPSRRLPQALVDHASAMDTIAATALAVARG